MEHAWLWQTCDLRHIYTLLIFFLNSLLHKLTIKTYKKNCNKKQIKGAKLTFLLQHQKSLLSSFLASNIIILNSI